jgi:hypothetical protein
MALGVASPPSWPKWGWPATWGVAEPPLHFFFKKGSKLINFFFKKKKNGSQVLQF